MMTGRVTALREVTLNLTVIGPGHRQQAVDAVLDTGFNGFLTLPSHVVRTLRLPFVGHRRATLGDGSIVVLDLYLATVLSWTSSATRSGSCSSLPSVQRYSMVIFSPSM